jgi:hypothetical protein
MVEPKASNSPELTASVSPKKNDLENQVRAEVAAELTARVALAKRGQSFAFASLVLILAATVTLGLTGHDWLAGGIAGAYLVSIVGLFITGQYRRQ